MGITCALIPSALLSRAVLQTKRRISMMIKTILDIGSPLLKALVKKIIDQGPNTQVKKNEVEELGKMLTGRLFHMLEYMHRHRHPIYPFKLGEELKLFSKGDAEQGLEKARKRLLELMSQDYTSVDPQKLITELESYIRKDIEWGWEKAAQYACYYLSLLGLVQTYGGLSEEVSISPLGDKVVLHLIQTGTFK
ncbi:MAG: hypothetical protein HXS54_10435 [Theionarchaea archaeon]|nr:hypothetical protein [Theionarchaea archaeon]